MTNTATPELTAEQRELRLACQMAQEIERACRIVGYVHERNANICERGCEWDELADRVLDEHVGDPLSIDVQLSGTYADYQSGDLSDMTLDHVDVLLGTGGPARGIEFRAYGDARVWHQDWGTQRAYAVLDDEAAEILAGHWGIDFP